MNRKEIVEICYEIADKMAPGDTPTAISIRCILYEFSREVADELSFKLSLEKALERQDQTIKKLSDQ